ncbi:ABC transporter ATP-binding protein [Pontivivens insulae]|uniref:Maltose/maltodextrin import ATP-binding protein MalK n=1 Tax=Pontivivens insulae TaxID=1639689 RepID=A0A2R8A6P5_9RHOB|nr:sn-glycerol-3-phosphate ABC transporter ATP-binding protein UgpC [Pontivivens insulae]RED17943.1 maltose ABC transporter ATP-binding protein /trehalose ABC transporter ATP-binding protein /sucrose ABC transporter ATP-binding protein [Pontivivens insulae]SPF27832.1 Maltose/maltodextrin import ATP-binding protein MalK [Pontivivens insulae]
MSSLLLKDVAKSYGPVEVLKDINLDIEKGELIVFVGPSGCGKSTLLRMIAGLETITGGDLYIGEQRMNDTPPSKRGIAMVFQSYALYPHMTVYDNMAFALKVAKMSKDEIDERVKRAAKVLQLDVLLERLPKELSGGQRQRVAIGRSIVRDPDVYLFDEPLSNLDAALRVDTRIEIAQLKENMPESTMIYVTHDQVEAMTLASRIVVLNNKTHTVAQFGTPLELYERPQNTFVAQFIGSPKMNLFPGTISASGDQTGVAIAAGGTATVPVSSAGAGEGTKVQLGARPEDMIIAGPGDEVIFEGQVSYTEKLGEVTVVYFAPRDGEDGAIAKIPGIADVSKGQQIALTAAADKLHLFDEAGQSFFYK